MEALAGFSAATLHEVSDRSVVLPCELRPVWPGARVLGPAYTVSHDAGRNLWLHEAIYRAPEGSVLVVGDRDGVVSFPGADLQGIAERAEAREAGEERMRRRLSTGERLLDMVFPPLRRAVLRESR